jgi:hypothetical protein
MRTPLGLLAAFSGLVGAAMPAAAQQSDAIWACVDDQGHKIFQNVGSGRGCRRIDGLIATIPGTSSSPAASQSASPSGTRGVSPANFPRIDQSTQRQRDGDRRRILEDELQQEQQRLIRLREEFNNGTARPGEIAGGPIYQERVQRLLEDIQRSEGFIASLKREMAPPRY